MVYSTGTHEQSGYLKMIQPQIKIGKLNRTWYKFLIKWREILVHRTEALKYQIVTTLGNVYLHI